MEEEKHIKHERAWVDEIEAEHAKFDTISDSKVIAKGISWQWKHTNSKRDQGSNKSGSTIERQIDKYEELELQFKFENKLWEFGWWARFANFKIAKIEKSGESNSSIVEQTSRFYHSCWDPKWLFAVKAAWSQIEGQIEKYFSWQVGICELWSCITNQRCPKDQQKDADRGKSCSWRTKNQNQKRAGDTKEEVNDALRFPAHIPERRYKEEVILDWVCVDIESIQQLTASDNRKRTETKEKENIAPDNCRIQKTKTISFWVSIWEKVKLGAEATETKSGRWSQEPIERRGFCLFFMLISQWRRRKHNLWSKVDSCIDKEWASIPRIGPERSIRYQTWLRWHLSMRQSKEVCPVALEGVPHEQIVEAQRW